MEKIVGPEQNFWSQNFLSEINFESKKSFESKTFLIQKKFGQKKIFVQIFFRFPKKLWIKKKILVTFGPPEFHLGEDEYRSPGIQPWRGIFVRTNFPHLGRLNLISSTWYSSWRWWYETVCQNQFLHFIFFLKFPNNDALNTIQYMPPLLHYSCGGLSG